MGRELAVQLAAAGAHVLDVRSLEEENMANTATTSPSRRAGIGHPDLHPHRRRE